MKQNAKLIQIAYWATTALFSLAMAASGFVDLFNEARFMAVLDHLGYPYYLASILGIAKILGVAAILFNRFRTIKEWAFAGFTFDLLGACVSHVIVGDSVLVFGQPLGLWFLMLLNYYLWKTRSNGPRLVSV